MLKLMARPEYGWPGLNLHGKTMEITKHCMKSQRFFTHSVLYLCFSFIVPWLSEVGFALEWGRWLKFVCNVCAGAVSSSIPHEQELPGKAESRFAQFSEDRDDLGRGGDHSWYAGNVREEPSVAQLHLLLLIVPFHILWGFGCCLLFLGV